METKPVIYILHGSWHSPLFFESARRKFELLGYTVICPQQPSTGAVPPTNTLYDDADLVRAELELLIEHGQDVVLVMHSYGGMVGTQAAAGLGKAEREKRGQAGGVARLFYACSFILPLGHHLCTAIGGELAPFIQSKEDGSCTPINPEQVFYQDLLPAEQKYWAAQLKPQGAVTQKNPLTKVAYREIPVSYLYCENDQALPLDLQKLMVKSSGLKVQEFTCSAGHSPFLSQPDLFVECVVKASKTAT